VISYLSRHLQVLFSTLGDMRRAPMTSLNTIMIVAITLFLPSLLYIAVKSAQTLSSNWQGRPQISLFLQMELDTQETQLIYDEIRLHPAIALAELVSPAQAMAEFRVLSELDFEIDFLGSNPLPASIVVMPTDEFIDSDGLLSLKAQLEKIEGIETIRLDLDWTDRFNALLRVFTRVATMLSGLLAFALVLIVGNTIKLLIINRRHEIEITKLVGGTNIFVRRPFLYYGTLFGLLGACLTLALLSITAKLLREPLSQLSSLYQNQTLLHQLSISELLIIIAIGGGLGWLAARWSVAQHLRKIQPQ